MELVQENRKVPREISAPSFQFHDSFDSQSHPYRQPRPGHTKPRPVASNVI
jgi:hypothetical protein